MFTRILF